MELLVVVAIIAIATAMAMPTISKFMKGQRLNQAGRMIQSAFSEARGASITQRADHYVFIGRIHAAGGVGNDIYALHVFRKGVGWEPGNPTLLPSSVQPLLDNSTPPLILGCHLKLQDWTEGLPPATGGQWGSNTTGVSDANSNPFTNNDVKATWPYHQLRKDGTIALRSNCRPSTPPPDLYDLNVPVLPGLYSKGKFLSDEANKCWADIALEQIGETSKMCYVSIDQNTGRVRFRVVEGEDLTGTGTVGH
jgi:type II secretory pathway pseudopilin PulG